MTNEAFLGGHTEEVEKDICLPRTVTLPLLLFRLCKRYNISVSEATQEGALMLLRQNDAFMDSDGELEKVYRSKTGKYKDKVETFANTLNKITTGGSL